MKQPRAFSIQEYVDANCTQFDDDRNFIITVGLHSFTKGRMCDGCPKMQFNCASYKKLLALDKQSIPKPQPTETVREEAARRNISISEVRRQRHKQMRGDSS